MVGGDSLVDFGKDATMSAGSCVGGSGGALYLASGRTVRVSVSFLCGRGVSVRGRGVSLPSAIRRSADLRSVAMSSADTVGTCLYALRHHDSPTQNIRGCGHLVTP